MAQREGIMLAYEFNPKRFERYPKPVITQPKIEGDRCRAVFDSHGKVTLLSSSAKERVSVPHIKKQLESLNLKNIELDGELYHHHMLHEEIRSIVSRTRYLHPNYQMIQFYVFDIINHQPQLDRANQYIDLLYHKLPDVIPVPFKFCHNLEELDEQFDEYLKSGYEGIIIRNPKALYKRAKSADLMKLKPRLSGVYKIIGCTEEMTINGEPKACLGSLLLEDDFGNRFHVGSGFTRKQREALWRERDKLIGKYAKIRYQALTHNFIPKMASFEEIIINP